MERKMYDLTAPQKSIYLTEQYFKGSSINNNCGTALIDEKIDFDLLSKATNLVIERNDSFRIHLCIENNEIQQYIAPYKPINFEIMDIVTIDELHKLEYSLATHAFDLFSDLFFIQLFRFPNGHGGFIVDAHHIISDSWTHGFIAKQIIYTYSCLVKGEEPDFSNVFSYIDYIHSEEEYKNSDKFEKDKQYWHSIFETIPEAATIPSTKNSSDSFSCKANRLMQMIDSKEMTKINEFCKRNHVSVFNFFMAIYSIYLGRASGINDFVIGSPILNRTNFKEKNTSGMFVNVVPYRINLQDDISFCSFVTNLAKSSLGTLRHQKYSYQYILEDLRKQDAHLPNLYNTLMSYQVTKTNIENGLNYKTTWSFNDTCDDDIDIHIYDLNDEGSVNIAYDYRLNKYDETEISALHERLLHMIHQVLHQENIMVSDIEIITPKEKYEILYKFNETTLDYPRDKTIVDLFEEQVEKTPNSIVAICEDKTLTYQELNEKSNQLARYITSLNIPTSSTIGILLKRSLDIYVCMLGILKSNHNYMLIDYNLPHDRIEYMLKNSNSTTLITTSIMNKDILLENIVYLDKINFTFDNTNLEKQSDALSPACVIYTSGSTGTPKGVILTNRGIVNIVISHQKLLHTDKLHTFLSMSTVSFDMFQVETYVALLCGGTIILTSEEEQQSPKSLQNLIVNHKVDFILTTPSKIELFMMNEEKNCLQDVKVIQLGGEIFSSSLYKKLRSFTNANIYNGYGPTEITACCSMKKLTSSDITIGTPLCNTKIFICDKSLNLLPTGVIGELCVSGDGISLGYINNEELTKKVFVKSNFSDNLIYRTGDLAYIDNSYEIRYVRRNDNQVKLRGLRIELNEISSRIKEISGVKNSVAIIRDVNGNKSICAYISVNASSHIEKQDVKNYLKQYLPDYMIPTFIVFLEEIPLTINGKIDTKKLPDIVLDSSNITYASTKIEKELENICKNYLSSNVIDVNSSLFEIGGDSLFAIKLASDILSHFNVNISVKDIFDHPTIRNLAIYISSLSKTQIDIIKPVKKMDYYPASSAQKRIYYASTIAGKNSILYNTSAGLIFDKKPDIKKLEDCFKTLISHHEILRTCFEIIDGNLVQKVLDYIPFGVEIYPSKMKSKTDCFEHFVKPFDLSKSPLIRVSFYSLTDGTYLLLLDIHHIICDGISFDLLIEELCNLYYGEKSNCPNLTYKDFAVWEQEKLQNDGFKEDKIFWLKQLDGELPVLNMPTSYPRPAIQSFAGKKIFRKIDKETKNKIDNMCHKLHTTPYLFLLSIYYILLYKYTSQEDILVGSPIVGRNHKEISQVIGMFVNTLVLRNKVDSHDTFSSFVNRVSNYCLSCFEHQEYPFDELVNDLKPTRDSSRNVLFDVMFSYQNTGKPILHLDNISSGIYMPETNISKFDILLEIIPSTDDMELYFEYCTDLFSEEFMNAFSLHYLTILDCVLTYPNIAISNIDLLTEFERNQLLMSFQPLKLPYPGEESIIGLFEKMVKQYPESIAVSDGEVCYTYSELDLLANQYASVLIANGVKKQEVVATLLNRSCSLIISMLAIMKVGAIYLPLSLDLPKERLEYILENSKAKLYISKEDYSLNIPFLNLEDLTTSKKCYIRNEKIMPEDVLYIIYTSGSTGLPKGVKVSNKNLNNFIHSFKKLYNNKINNNDICLASTNISFDVSIWEFFFTLLNGAELYLYEEPTIKNIVNYCNTFIEHSITIAYIPPNILEEVYSILCQYKPICLNKILIGVEPIKSIVIQKYFDLNPDMQIVNGYGPTETTICCTAYVVTKDNVNNYPIIPIGNPLYNVKGVVLDNDKSLVPIGVTGQLYISGDNVSLGYLNNDNLTDEKFINLPVFGKEKFYNTGDLVKWDSNGILNFVGRKDHQIKLNGHRIELSEIEKNIYTYPQIDKCIVLLKEVSDGNKKIICYFTAYEDVNLSDLKSFLQRKLPSYFIPNFFKQLKSFKLTSNGKIDRKYLETLKIETSSHFEPPQNEVQKKLVDIWSSLLNCDKVGIHDNFFDLGGDSLIAIKMQIECLHENLTISYADIFNYPTIYQLDKKLHQTDSKKQEEELYDYSDIENLLSKNDFSLSHFTKRKIGTVLLAGSTGFVGAHILAELLEHTTDTIYCLVRIKNNMSPEARLLDTLQFYFGEKYHHLIGSRIIVVNGDITKAKLGLSNNEYEKLGNMVHTFINSAALVKHYGRSKLFLDTNIEAVKRMIEFCTNFHIPFYHISTLSISGNVFAEDSFKASQVQNEYTFTEKDFYIGQDLSNIYLSSKFTAERMIFEAILQKNLQAKILRLGNITNRASDGMFQLNVSENAFLNRIKSFIELRAIPDYLLDGYTEFTPVDKCAEAIVKIVSIENPYYVFHLFNHNHITLKRLVELMNKFGLSIETLCASDFKQLIESYLDKDDSKSSLSGIINDFDKEKKLVYESKITLSDSLTTKFLDAIDFHWPIIDEDYIHQYFLYLKTIHYIN